jgi:hypothetical protein
LIHKGAPNDLGGRKSNERVLQAAGWLNSRHTFSLFKPITTTPNTWVLVHCVINEDRIEGGNWLKEHGHRDMVIICTTAHSTTKIRSATRWSSDEVAQRMSKGERRSSFRTK